MARNSTQENPKDHIKENRNALNEMTKALLICWIFCFEDAEVKNKTVQPIFVVVYFLIFG